MTKYLVILFVVLLLGAFWINFQIANPTVTIDTIIKPTPHAYQNPLQSIARIHVTFVYFVPKNKLRDQSPAWQELLGVHLQKLIAFHELQLRGLSQLTYEVHPYPVVGHADASIYEHTPLKNVTSPTLVNVKAELDERMNGGDLISLKPEAGAYNILYILYEGSGADAGDNVAMISRPYLTVPEYTSTSDTLFAYEFYRALGLPAGDAEGAYLSKDVMGLGRFRPLERTFIDDERLKQLGI